MLWSLAVLPILGAAVILAAGLRHRLALATLAGSTLAVTLLAACLAVQGDWNGTLAWKTTLQLQADLTPLSAVMAILVPAVALPVLLYAAVHEHRWA